MIEILIGFILIPLGYNIVHKIPKGATHIMISQHSYNRKKDDDSYLGKYLYNEEVITF